MYDFLWYPLFGFLSHPLGAAALLVFVVVLLVSAWHLR